MGKNFNGLPPKCLNLKTRFYSLGFRFSVEKSSGLGDTIPPVCISAGTGEMALWLASGCDSVIKLLMFFLS